MRPGKQIRQVPPLSESKSACSFAFLLIIYAGIIGCSKPAAAPVRPFTAQEANGHRLYRIACANCHGEGAVPASKGPGMNGIMKKKYLPSGLPATDEHVRDSIVRGRRMMPALAGQLSESDVADIIAYLKKQ